MGMTGFGNSAFRILAGHPSIELLGVITPQRQDNPFPYYECEKLQDLVREYGSTLYEGLVLKDHSTYEVLNELSPDLIIVSSFDQIVPLNIIRVPSLGVLNVHPSLLPKYRGATPTVFALMNGENETGVTAHFIEDEALDRGRIIAQASLCIGPLDNDGILRRKLADLSEKVLDRAIVEVLGKRKEEFPQQDESKASYYPKRTLRDAEIDIRRPLNEIVNRVRAMSPYPGAFLTYKGIKCKVKAVSAFEEGIAMDAIAANDGEIIVQAPSGAIKFIVQKEN
jgi:methionyl-tRNA formyltransferase